jgi:hypothetical protein
MSEIELWELIMAFLGALFGALVAGAIISRL